MSRLQIMMIEIGALLILSFIIRLVINGLGVEEGMFSRWFPILAALLIVYSIRFRIRKKLLGTKNINNDNEKQN
ncbi:hypothetical protein OAK52_01255 [Chloroflexi bacterium]|nr:hypothetical protein [Chloroflexota bacterium]MDC0252773.1 hypothetical protein [Chloroflexota bacterium]RZP12595.1 MAG: hypothetical protein EVA32_06670 [Chloroflexota bacterium]